MRRHLLAILAVCTFVIYSCKNHPKGDCCAEEDTLAHVQLPDSGATFNVYLLKGRWMETTDSSIVLTIADSVTYRQTPGVAYPYTVKKDSLFIAVENIPFSARIITATPDSLVLENKGLITRYFKTGQ